jgi:hypothetical protein
MPSGDAEPIVVETSGRLPDPQRPGKLNANLNLSLANTTAKNLNDIALLLENIPLDILQPAFARLGIQAQTSGWLSADIHTSLADKGNPEKTTVEGNAMTENFVLAMPALGTDQIRLTSFRADGKCSVSSRVIDIEPSSVVCDLCNVRMSGSIPLTDSTGKTAFSAMSFLRQHCEINGSIDLARLAAMLPKLLNIREGTKVTSGEVKTSFSSRPKENDPKSIEWQGKVEAVNLTASDNGRQLSWTNPIVAGFTAHEEAQGIFVDSMDCKSDFLQISGNGTTAYLTAKAMFDLKQLATQLGQFVKLDSYQLAGQGRIDLTWKRDAQQQFDTRTDIHLQNFQVVLSDQTPWYEPDLTTTLEARGKTDFSAKNTAIDAAGVELTAGTDQFTAQLREPVKSLADGGVWPLQIIAKGQVQNWLSRAAAFVPLAGYRAAGTCNLESQLTASAASIDIASAVIHANQLALTSPSINLNEPQVDLTATGSWNTKQRRLNIASALLTNSTINVSAKDFVLSTPENGPLDLAGSVEYQCSLPRLRQCFADPTQPSVWSIGGLLGGNAQFKQTDGVIHCTTAAEVTDLAVGDATGQKFHEAKIALNAVAEYDNKTKYVKIDKAEISSSTVAASALGQVGMKDQTSADINGQVIYDLNRISDLLQPTFGRKVRLFGRGSGPVTWRGPLSLDKGQAATELQWDRAYAYGFDIGPATVKPRLEGGIVTIDPMQIDVSQGKLLLAPKVRLSPTMELTMPPGPLAQQVQISKDMCDMFLMYLAPILADVTDARGSFSIELLNCRLPLLNPKQGDLAGKFIVHDVEIGPGPLIKELATLMERETPAKLRQQSVVNFQMYQGRIYHDNMELIFPEFTIRTRGSVGIDDQTLALEANMPIPPKWLVNNPAATALKDQTLALPIGGTLAHPQLDRAKIEEYTRQFIRKAAGNILEEGLNKGLDQLFKQPK